MKEISFIIDELNGTLLVEDTPELNPNIREQLATDLGRAREMGCARPLSIIPPPIISVREKAASICVRIAGYYHNSLCEGPGRRSSVLFQSCPLKCKGCWVTQLHSEETGELVPVAQLVKYLLDPKYQRNGISILGGEPFAQANGLLALVKGEDKAARISSATAVIPTKHCWRKQSRSRPLPPSLINWIF